MQLVLIEDTTGGGHFGPLTLLRPEFDLRCGALTLREKIELRRPDWRVVLAARPGLSELVAEQCPGRGLEVLDDAAAIALYGRVVADDDLIDALGRLSGESLLTAGGEVLGAALADGARERLSRVVSSGEGLESLGISNSTEIPARAARYPWDLVAWAADGISADAALVGRLGSIDGSVHDGAHVVAGEGVWVGEGSSVAPGVVLDASSGPILVGSDVTVMPGAVLLGPVFVGDRSIVRAGAAIWDGSCIGPVCRVGGEIQGTVFQSHSNKQHGGFLGHSYVASWVNLGAATDNSDLKNNYGSVRVELNGAEVDTGLSSVGGTIGDHTKTAIGTKLNTGAVVGVFCNVIWNGFPPKTIPSFSWGTEDGLVRHDLEKALATARTVMARRGENLTPALEAVVRNVFEETG